jgi:3-phenylpropionate/trans-cinnamate dioxygenase alpha subunit
MERQGSFTAAVLDPAALVDPGKGLVKRHAYVDQGIYDLELERIFARSWLYLAHTSQLREPGDYVATFMGDDPVIVSRGADGEIRTMLNSCRHRGNTVCRSDEGNTSFFQCSYHGWTYSNQGDLVGVPKYRQAYGQALDKKEWGLLQVPRVEEYLGFVFGNWDAEAPDLADYLGGMRYYLDLAFGRDPEGVEMIGGVHKWAVDTNWKVPTENFATDMYHVNYSHKRVVELGLMEPFTDDGYEIAAGMGFLGHDFTPPVAEDFGEHAEDPTHRYWVMPNPYTEFLKSQRRHMAEKMGEDAARMIPVGHGAVFPSFAFLDIEMLRLVRVHIPRGPGQTMFYQWCVVDKSLPQDVKDALRRQYQLTFGPSGILEQDDGENWRQLQVGCRGYVGRQLDTNMVLGLGQDRPAVDIIGQGAPGEGGGIWSEANQRAFWRHWLAFMTTERTTDIRSYVDNDAP